jgi:hypothetical protein
MQTPDATLSHTTTTTPTTTTTTTPTTTPDAISHTTPTTPTTTTTTDAISHTTHPATLSHTTSTTPDAISHTTPQSVEFDFDNDDDAFHNFIEFGIASNGGRLSMKWYTGHPSLPPCNALYHSNIFFHSYNITNERNSIIYSWLRNGSHYEPWLIIMPVTWHEVTIYQTQTK